MTDATRVERAYELARERYAEWGVDTEEALAALGRVSVSLHCWQGDDVGGFETPDAELTGGGIQVTGNFPGKARTVAELRMDVERVLSLLPGSHRFNLHAIYGEFGGARVDRDAIEPEHYAGWIEWARSSGVKLDFNATCFSHPLADSGLTLSHTDGTVRAFWVEHVKRCRAVAAVMGRELGGPAIHNLWIPDGFKDTPADRWAPRARLIDSLDAIFEDVHPASEMKDAVESKLFGIGSEACTVGSHEFYLGYALTRGLMVCLDTGHFHPTESVADKLSAVLPFTGELLLHVSRGVRWDSDHVVIVNDELAALARELVSGEALDRVYVALDFFDASINRVGAWVTGTRATLRALLAAMLEPAHLERDAEATGDGFTRLAVMEEARGLPHGAVWDYHCLKSGVPAGEAWIREVKDYEEKVLAERG